MLRLPEAVMATAIFSLSVSKHTRHPDHKKLLPMGGVDTQELLSPTFRGGNRISWTYGTKMIDKRAVETKSISHSMKYWLVFAGVPLFDYDRMPNMLGSRIPNNNQPTEVLNTAQVYIAIVRLGNSK